MCFLALRPMAVFFFFAVRPLAQQMPVFEMARNSMCVFICLSVSIKNKHIHCLLLLGNINVFPISI